MTDTGQEDIDPDSKQYRIDNQDWKKSKVLQSPQRDEDKQSPRGRGRGWRARAKESPTPGSRQVNKDISRDQRSSDQLKDSRKDDEREDTRTDEEEARKRLREERRNEDERKWEEDKGWRGGVKKETSKQETAEKARKPRRAAQEVYVPRARRQAQQLYVPKARRDGEKPKSEPVDKETTRAANPREPPEKKRIITNHKQEQVSRSSQKVKSQKLSRRSDELRHKGDKYIDSTDERFTSRRNPDKPADVRHSSRSDLDSTSDVKHSSRSDPDKPTDVRHSSRSDPDTTSDVRHTSRNDPDRTSDVRHSAQSDPNRTSVVKHLSRSDPDSTIDVRDSSRSDPDRTSDVRHSSRRDPHRPTDVRHTSRSDPDRTSDVRHSSRSDTDRTSDVRHLENKNISGDPVQDDSAAIRQVASKQTKKLSSFFSSLPRTDDVEGDEGDLSVSVHIEKPKTCTTLPVSDGTETMITSSESRSEIEDNRICKPPINHRDQFDTSQENKATEHEFEPQDVCSSSTLQAVSSVRAAVLQDDCAIARVEQTKCEMTDSVCNSEVTESHELTVLSNEGTTMSAAIPDQDNEIEHTVNLLANDDRVGSSPSNVPITNSMDVSDELAQEQLTTDDRTLRSDTGGDEVDKDISDRADEIEKMDNTCRGEMEWEGEGKEENAKVEENNSMSSDQVDRNSGSCPVDVIEYDDKPDGKNVDGTKGDSLANMVFDNEGDCKRTRVEDSDMATAPTMSDARVDDVPERTGVSDTPQVVIQDCNETHEEEDKGTFLEAGDISGMSTNITYEHVGDSESVQVNNINSVGVSAQVDAISEDMAQNEQKQQDIFHDALTHRDSEDYGSSSSDAANYGDVEKSSSSSQDDAMDAEDGGGGSGGGDKMADGDSWDALFDDTGESLKAEEEEELAKGIGKVKVSVKKAKHDYYNWQPKDNMDYSAFEHVIEVYDFPADFKTPDLVMSFSDFKNKGFDIKWVDDTHALAIFATPLVAHDALGLMNPMFRTRPLALATRESKMKAKKSIEFLKPFKPKPETTAVAARRLISGALGLKSRVTREQREAERRKLREAKDKKRADRQQTHDIWEGNI